MKLSEVVEDHSTIIGNVEAELNLPNIIRNLINVIEKSKCKQFEIIVCGTATFVKLIEVEQMLKVMRKKEEMF